MNKPRDLKFHIIGLDIKKTLGIDIGIHAFSSLSSTIRTKQVRTQLDTDLFFTQHVTTGFKIGTAAYYLSQLKLPSFDKLFGQNAQTTSQVKSKEIYDFALTLECFFIFSWGSIISAMRELWMAYAIGIDRSKVNFHNVKEKLKVEHPRSAITNHLQVTNDSGWFKYLNGARNRIEHGQIILYNTRRKDKKTFLADNQYVDARFETYKREYDPVRWPCKIFGETRKLIEYCSADMQKLLY